MTDLRVGYITQWFPPEPVQVPIGIARSLRARGAEVRVLTGVPNYPSGRVLQGYRASRRLSEQVDGFAVRRTPLFPSHSRSVLGRMGNYLSWATSSALMGGAVTRWADVNLVYSSPAPAAAAAMRAKRRFGVPYVLFVQDIWPDSVFASGMAGQSRPWRAARAVLDRAVAATYRHAAHIAVISPSAVGLLVSRGVPRDKISLVYNWADEELYVPRPRTGWLRNQLNLSDSDRVVLYAGNHGAAQGLATAIAAAQSLRGEKFHLVLVGDGVEKVSLVAQAGQSDNVHFLDPVSTDRVPALAADCDAQLVSLIDDDLFRLTMPSKVQASMAGGSPVIASAPGDVASVVTRAAAGFVAAPGDTADLASAFRALVDAPAHELKVMGANARRFYLDHMSEQVGAGRLASVLRNAAKDNERGVR